MLRLSVVEGVLYAGMVGLAEFWWVADAVRMNAGPLAIAALVTVPQLVGALGALGMLRALRGAPARRPLVTAAVAGQGLGLAVLAGLAATGRTTPTVLVAVACLHHAFGQAAGTGWASWFGDLVPARLRGRWFGGRNRFVHATTFTGILVGGLVLHGLEPTAAAADGAGGLGYALIYGVAAALRLGCASLLWRSWEPRFVPPEAHEDLAGVLRGPDGAAGRGVLAVGAAMLLSVCVASPFFAPHMLETLGFSYPTYLASQGLLVACKVASLGLWGRWVDRFGPAPVYRVAALLIALVPVPWVFADRAWIVFAAQALSGCAWAGHEVAILGLTLAAVGSRRRAVLLAAQSVANGASQTVGGLLGSGLASAVGGEHAVMFAASSAARLLVVGLAPLALAPLWTRRVRWRDVAARVVGWRPHGGVTRALIDPGEETPGPSDRV